MSQTPAPAIQANLLTKSYGLKRGIFGLNLEIERGEIFGFLGPNGSGKTTTIRLLMGLIRPGSGSAHILGKDTQREQVAVHREVGYLPGEFAVDPHLTGRQLLRYLRHLRAGVDPQSVQHLASRLDIDLDHAFGQLSRGNKQKIGLIQAFMHHPAVLILDEPTSGLDPLNQEAVLDMIREAQSAGSTIFLSSHILSEVEAVAHRVGFVREGTLLGSSTVEQLLNIREHEIEAECAESLPQDVLARVPEARSVSVHGNVLTCLLRGDMDGLIKALSHHHVRRLTSREPSLNDVFLRMYGHDHHTTVVMPVSETPAFEQTAEG